VAGIAATAAGRAIDDLRKLRRDVFWFLLMCY
jgi:hypothetical protein